MQKFGFLRKRKAWKACVAGPLAAVSLFSMSNQAIASGACDDANAGMFNLSGNQLATSNFNITPSQGEVFKFVLAGLVTNSLIIINGATLASGNTSGTFNYNVTATAAMLLALDIKGNSTARLIVTCAAIGAASQNDPAFATLINMRLMAFLLANNFHQTIATMTNIAGNEARALLTPVAPPPQPTINRSLIARRLFELRKERKPLEKIRNILAEGRDDATLDTYLSAFIFEDNSFKARQAAVDKKLAEIDAEIKRLEDQLNSVASSHATSIHSVIDDLQPVVTLAYSPTTPFSTLNTFNAIGLGTIPLGSITTDTYRIWGQAGVATNLGTGNLGFTGTSGYLSVGAARKINSRFAIEALVAGLTGDFRANPIGAVGSYQGFATYIAPVYRISDDVYLTIYGQYSQAHFRQLVGGATASFNAHRFGTAAKLSGKYVEGGITYQPEVSVGWNHDMVDGFTASNGVTVAATNSDNFRVRAGGRVSKPILTSSGRVFTPFTTLHGNFNATSGTATLTQNGFTLDFSAGVLVTFDRQTNLQFAAGLSNIFDANRTLLTFSARLNKRW